MQIEENRFGQGGLDSARPDFITEKPLFVSGYGQFHSNESTAKNPKPYEQIGLEGIRHLVDNPQEVDKSEAQWLIPSTLPSRTFKEQETNGEYHLLWADIDKDPPNCPGLLNHINLMLQQSM